MKQLVQNSCTGCHTPSYILQHKFDERGWNAIINLMKHVNVSGIYQGPEHKAAPVLDHDQKKLAAYLARARGPGETSMKFNLRPRPTGEAARAVFTDYEAPPDPDVGLPYKVQTNNGTDWSLGTPSYIYPGFGVHDAWIDAEGKNVYFTCNVPNSVLTLGKFDLKTGAFTPLKVTAANGLAAPTHGMTRDPNGVIWFNVNPGKGGLGKLDTKTDKIEVFIPPEGMAPTGGATTVDYDGRGMIWVSSPTGALRFDPTTEKFTEYKSPTPKSATGSIGLTYGVAADRDGNGYWAQMAMDTIGIGDGKYGTAKELKLPPNPVARRALHARADRLLRQRRRPRLLEPDPLRPGAAAHGHRQERRRALHRQLLGRHAHPREHPHPGNQHHPAAAAAQALPGRGRRQPQRLAQHLDDRPGAQIRPEGERVHRLRHPDPRLRSALRLAVREGRPGPEGGPALLPHPQGDGDVVPHATPTSRRRRRKPRRSGREI